MANKIRLGFVGANVNSTWSSQSHFPALLASPDVELTAVCTSRPESAEEARQAFGAKLAFHDFPGNGVIAGDRRGGRGSGGCHRTMSQRKPPSKPASTYTPSGHWAGLPPKPKNWRTLARAKGVQTAVGLQSRVSPALLYIKGVNRRWLRGRGAVLSRHHHAWTAPYNALPAAIGISTLAKAQIPLTIANGHVIDALRNGVG